MAQDVQVVLHPWLWSSSSYSVNLKCVGSQAILTEWYDSDATIHAMQMVKFLNSRTKGFRMSLIHSLTHI